MRESGDATRKGSRRNGRRVVVMVMLGASLVERQGVCANGPGLFGRDGEETGGKRERLESSFHLGSKNDLLARSPVWGLEGGKAAKRASTWALTGAPVSAVHWPTPPTKEDRRPRRTAADPPPLHTRLLQACLQACHQPASLDASLPKTRAIMVVVVPVSRDPTCSRSLARCKTCKCAPTALIRPALTRPAFTRPAGRDSAKAAALVCRDIPPDASMRSQRPAPGAMGHGVQPALPRTTTVHKGFGMIGRREGGAKRR